MAARMEFSSDGDAAAGAAGVSEGVPDAAAAAAGATIAAGCATAGRTAGPGLGRTDCAILAAIAARASSGEIMAGARDSVRAGGETSGAADDGSASPCSFRRSAVTFSLVRDGLPVAAGFSADFGGTGRAVSAAARPTVGVGPGAACAAAGDPGAAGAAGGT